VRALNRKAKLNVYTKTENLNLALNAARSIGCQVVNIGAQDVIEGRPILILGLMWQIIRVQLLSQISIKNYPELVLLLDEGE
jgi:plastin-1